MKIRKLQPADIPHVLKLVRFNPAVEDYPGEFSQASFKQILRSKRSIALVAEDKKPVAIAIFHLDPAKKKVFFEAIVVAKKYRRSGIGSRLIQKMEQLVRKKTYNHIVFLAWTWNKPMLALGKKIKYKEKGTFVLFEKKI